VTFLSRSWLELPFERAKRENTSRAFHPIAVFWTEGRAEEVRCYSCSSGLCGVAVGLPLELGSVLAVSRRFLSFAWTACGF